MELSQEQIEKAVEWWANVLKGPEFKTLSDEERNRPDSRPTEMAETLAYTLNRKQGSPSDKTLEKFEDALREALRGDSPPYCLDVDYHPDQYLGAAAQMAGIHGDITTFPWKTTMWFQDGGVQVRCGYGASREEILK